MASGKYGIVAPSVIDIENDVEIFYAYQPDRQTEPLGLNTLIPNSVIKTFNEINTNPDNRNEIMGGLYKLTLPSNVFNQIGIYTILIRPKRIQTTILDCGSINTLPDVKGIILDSSIESLQPLKNKLTNGGLVGYRVEYLDDSNQIIKNAFTIVTWNNRAEAVSQNVGTSNQKSIAYRFNDSGSLVFVTLTPSVATNTLPSLKPYIGKPNQKIYLVNTSFDPIVLEVNLTRHDFDTLSYPLYSNVLENTQNGKLSVFDYEGNTFAQSTLSVIKDDEGNVPLYRIKEKLNDIDTNETIDNATQGVNNV
jgi:hypothetical protein